MASKTNGQTTTKRGQPSGVGIGLRREHHQAVFETDRRIDWFEVIAENVIDNGGSLKHAFDRTSEKFAVGVHGVSLNLGGPDPLSDELLRLTKALLDKRGLDQYSDHLCWSQSHSHQSFDLMPLPFTEDMVKWVAGRIRQTQDALERPMCVENVSTYAIMPVAPGTGLDEGAFHQAVCEEADCGLLLDVNNIYVTATNHGLDPHALLASMPLDRVRQMHIAGHAQTTLPDGSSLLVDDHGHPIIDPVFALLREACAAVGPVPVLLEWDTNVPELDRVLDEADRVRSICEEVWASSAAPDPVQEEAA